MGEDYVEGYLCDYSHDEFSTFVKIYIDTKKSVLVREPNGSFIQKNIIELVTYDFFPSAGNSELIDLLDKEYRCKTRHRLKVLLHSSDSFKLGIESIIFLE